jgi:hypothetical protein
VLWSNCSFGYKKSLKNFYRAVYYKGVVESYRNIAGFYNRWGIVGKSGEK